MKKMLFYIYQIIVLFPLVIILTIIIGLSIMLISPILPASKRDAYNTIMGSIWGKTIIKASLLKVSVEGLNHINSNNSYIFVANHLSCYDIFLVIGYLTNKKKWMLKASLMKIPFLGGACRMSGFIPVDTSSPGKIHETYTHAFKSARDGVSLMVFPEGSRSKDGKLGNFKRGAFMIADKLQIPVIPITIIGTYDVMPRHRDFKFIKRIPLKMIINKPIYPLHNEENTIEYLRRESHKIISQQLIENKVS